MASAAWIGLVDQVLAVVLTEVEARRHSTAASDVVEGECLGHRDHRDVLGRRLRRPRMRCRISTIRSAMAAELGVGSASGAGFDPGSVVGDSAMVGPRRRAGCLSPPRRARSRRTVRSRPPRSGGPGRPLDPMAVPPGIAGARPDARGSGQPAARARCRHPGRYVEGRCRRRRSVPIDPRPVAIGHGRPGRRPRTGRPTGAMQGPRRLADRFDRPPPGQFAPPPVSMMPAVSPRQPAWTVATPLFRHQDDGGAVGGRDRDRAVGGHRSRSPSPSVAGVLAGRGRPGTDGVAVDLDGTSSTTPRPPDQAIDVGRRAPGVGSTTRKSPSAASVNRDPDDPATVGRWCNRCGDPAIARAPCPLDRTRPLGRRPPTSGTTGRRSRRRGRRRRRRTGRSVPLLVGSSTGSGRLRPHEGRLLREVDPVRPRSGRTRPRSP